MAHEFTPIDSKAKYHEALNYIADNVIKLGEVVFNEVLPVDTICIFSHSVEEYEFLANLIKEYGPVDHEYSHGPTIYVNPEPGLVISNNSVRYLGVREPDQDRKEIGYADYPV